MQRVDTQLKQGLESGDNQVVLDFLATNPTALDNSRFDEQTFPNLVLKDITIRNADWTNLSLQNAKLINVTFDGGFFAGVDFSHSYLEGVRFLSSTMMSNGERKPNRRDTRFSGAYFNKVGMANTKLFDVMMDKLQPKSQLSLLNCQITRKLESVGSMFYEAKLNTLIIDGCDIIKTDLNYIEDADQIIIKNSHLDTVKMAGIIADKLTFTDNKKLNLLTSGKVDSVEVTNNKFVAMSAGFDTPLLVIHNNEFDAMPGGSNLILDGKIVLADIKNCGEDVVIDTSDTSVENLVVDNCNMVGFRAFDATIKNVKISNSSIGEIVAYNIKSDRFKFDNVSLDKHAMIQNVIVDDLDLSGLNISSELFYEGESYALFHSGETPVVTE